MEYTEPSKKLESPEPWLEALTQALKSIQFEAYDDDLENRIYNILKIGEKYHLESGIHLIFKIDPFAYKTVKDLHFNTENKVQDKLSDVMTIFAKKLDFICDVKKLALLQILDLKIGSDGLTLHIRFGSIVLEMAELIKKRYSIETKLLFNHVMALENGKYESVIKSTHMPFDPV